MLLSCFVLGLSVRKFGAALLPIFPWPIGPPPTLSAVAMEVGVTADPRFARLYPGFKITAFRRRLRIRESLPTLFGRTCVSVSQRLQIRSPRFQN
jgi:hypothetical protein